MANRRDGGFNLLELVIAIAILGLLLVVMIGVIPATIMGTRAACQRAVAVTIVQERLMSLRQAGPQAVKDESGTVIEDETTYRLETRRLGALMGTGSPPQPIDERLAVGAEVTVRWSNKQGPQSYQVQTVVGRDAY